MSSRVGAIERASTAGDEYDVWQQAVTAVLFTLCVLFVGLALLLVVRRVSGAFSIPLSGLAIVGVAVGLEVGVVVWRRILLRTKYLVLSTEWQGRLGQPTSSFVSQLPQLIPGVVAVAVLASLTIPGTTAWGLAFAWLVVIAGETVQWLVHYRPNLLRSGRTRLTSAPVEMPVEAEEPEIPAGLVQQVTRVLEGDCESIHALVRAEVAANDRLAVVHLAFCPPLAARPELTAHAMDTDDAEVRITQAEAFGVRIEVRLPKVEESARGVLIEVLGSVTAPREA